MEELVSIIIPVYNLEGKLNRCVDSVLGQSYSSFEILLIDDGSDDGSAEICDKYGEMDQRVRVFHKTRGGVSSARNLGLEKAEGKFITFVDGDDFVSDSYLSVLHMQEEELSIGSAFYANPDGSVESICHQEPDSSSDVTNHALTEWFSRGDLYSVWACMFLRSIIINHNLRFDTNLTRGEDVVFMLEYVEHCNKIRFCNQCIYYYVQYGKGGSSSSKLSRKNIMALDRLKVYLTNWFAKKEIDSPISDNNDYWINIELRRYFYDVVRAERLTGKKRKEYFVLLYSLDSYKNLKKLFEPVNPVLSFLIKLRSPIIMVVCSKLYGVLRRIGLAKAPNIVIEE